MRTIYLKRPILVAIVSALLLIAQVGAGPAVLAADARDQSPPSSYILKDYPRVKQLPNYCGPAVLATVLQYWGRSDQDQEMVGKSVYDPKIKATNGADLLFYARSIGFSAYSFNGSISSLKRLISQGLPIIVLQEMDKKDRSGHFRVVIGYSDRREEFHILDPYELDRTQMSYSDFSDLWAGKGNWGVLVLPADKDKLAAGLKERNPVVHLDLAQAYYRRGDYDDADREIRMALKLEPSSSSARDMLSRIEGLRGATGQGKQ